MNDKDCMKVFVIWKRVKSFIKNLVKSIIDLFPRKKGYPYPVYLNMPIMQEEEDIVGLDVSVKAIDSAINHGAQMIALTSPFGAGKSSIIELLKICRHLDKKKQKNKREKLFNISMWSQTSKGKELSSLDLHRHLAYEIAKGIDSKKGTYFHRRLSDNYGLVKFHINKFRYFVSLLFAVGLWALGGVINDQSKWIEEMIPAIKNYVPLLSIITRVIGVIVGLIPVLRAEIIISSIKTEKNRKIEEDEVIDLYRNEVLKPYRFLYNWPFFRKFKKRYIVVIEDLDRSSSSVEVIHFLKELRKYYTSGQGQTCYKNKVVFIVNIKPESLLLKKIDNQEKDNELIYAKLFDYVLDLQTINVDDYETILNGLLKEEQDNFRSLGIISNDHSEELSLIPGMQWLIHGKKVGIREIKHRINKAVLLFSALKDRFEKGDVSFEKCAVYSFLSTEFEEEFQSTNDESFGKLAEMRIKREITLEQGQDVLGERKDKDYISAVCELINSRLIDTNYRVYFYNYPRNSKVYTYEEKSIRDAILYDEEIDIEDGALSSLDNSDVIENALRKREQLRLRLPKSALKSDILFSKALHYVPQSVLNWMSNLDYTSEGVEKTIDEIIDILHFDSDRKYYDEKMAEKFCSIWTFSQDIQASVLMELRHKLCKEFPTEIIWYKPLFASSYDPITAEECAYISLDDILLLFDINNERLNINNLNILLGKFEQTDCKEQYSEAISSILAQAAEKFSGKDFALVLVQFMLQIQEIIPRFEEIVVENTRINEGDDKLFFDYQKLINSIPDDKITDKTLENIADFEYYTGFSDKVINQMEKHEYVIDSVVMRVMENKPVQYELPLIIDAISGDYDWLQRKGIFEAVRYHITCYCDNMLLYKFMFSEKMTLMTEPELDMVKTKLDVLDVLELIPATLVDESFAIVLTDYLNEKYRQKAYNIIKYISTLKPEIAKLCLEKLDFQNMFYYFRISKKKRDEIESIFESIMQLNAVENKLRFMWITKSADVEWIKDNIESIVGDEKLERQFIDVINGCHIQSVKPDVLKAINCLKTDFAMTGEIEQKLFDNQMYYKYVASRILRRGNVDMEDADSPLWEPKLRLFVETNNTKIIDCYSRNMEFIQKGMEIELYKRMGEEKRKIFTAVLQTSECLLDLLTGGYEENFILEYLSLVLGFANYKAAETFVGMAENNPFILASDEVYDNLHEKLLDPSLKRKYTIKRKAEGYMD